MLSAVLMRPTMIHRDGELTLIATVQCCFKSFFFGHIERHFSQLIAAMASFGPRDVELMRKNIMQNLLASDSFDGSPEDSPSFADRRAADSGVGRSVAASSTTSLTGTACAAGAQDSHECAHGLGAMVAATPTGRGTVAVKSSPSETFLETDSEAPPEGNKKKPMKRPAAASESDKAPALKRPAKCPDDFETPVEDEHGPGSEAAEPKEEGAGDDRPEEERLPQSHPVCKRPATKTAAAKAAAKAKAKSQDKQWCPKADYSYKDTSGVWEAGG